MLAVSEKDLGKLLHNLDHTKCQRLLKQLLSALGAFSVQHKVKTGDEQSQQATTTIHQPARTSIVSPKWGSTTLFMPVSDEQSTGFKVVTVPTPTTANDKPDNAAAIRGVINILSPEGRLEGVLSAAEITAFRTALASMIPFTGCPWIRKRRIVIFGSGKQAEWHARLALLTVSDPKEIEEITFVNRSQQRLDSTIVATLFPDLRQRYPHLVVKAYSQEREEANNGSYQAKIRADLALSDAIFCCTPSITPLFTHDDLTATGDTAPPKQRFISLIGSYKPHMQEIDSRTLLSGTDSKIYVDSVEACMEEAGELIMAKVDASQLIELGGLLPASSADDDLSTSTSSLLQHQDDHSGNVIFKCVGMGIMDLVIARCLLDMAREQGYGTTIDGF